MYKKFRDKDLRREEAAVPFADGIMIATQASLGQGTLHISPENAPDGFMGGNRHKNRKTGEAPRVWVAGFV